MQYAPFKSFVDAGFFTELSDRKLNDLKLSEQEVPIFGTYSVPVSDNSVPDISLSGAGFSSPDSILKSTPPLFVSPGTIKNLNTLESFKALDKTQFLRDNGAVIARSIWDGSAVQDPSVLTRFAVVAFSDLKKYRFYYWFGFPAINAPLADVRVAEKGAASEVERSGAVEAALNWRKSLTSTGPGGFFLLRKDESDHWLAANLAQHEGFWDHPAHNQLDPTRPPTPAIPTVGFFDPSSVPNVPGWPLRNFIALLSSLGFEKVRILAVRDSRVSASPQKSIWFDVTITTKFTADLSPSFTGWERNGAGKLVPKFADLGALIDPNRLADQAVNLNLKLMKWRISPGLNLDSIQHNKCLLLGAGTLGSNVARALLGWGVKKITLVDSSKVSFSNPVRQSLYKFSDCLDGGASKATRAAEALKEIYPSVDAQGHELEIPMLGHSIRDPERQKKEYEALVSLIDSHDTVFILLDSRESRWLPTVIAAAKRKQVINVALGFDSYVVMRHGIYDSADTPPALGCYFCNDVVAPVDSLTNQTLDQMCTVTRPGIAMIASALSVELLSSVLQHPLRGSAAAVGQPGGDVESEEGPLSQLPHQLRGFLRTFDTLKVWGPGFSACSACSPTITSAWADGGWEFVSEALGNPGMVEELSGLAEVQRQAEEAAATAIDFTDDELE